MTGHKEAHVGMLYTHITHTHACTLHRHTTGMNTQEADPPAHPTQHTCLEFDHINLTCPSLPVILKLFKNAQGIPLKRTALLSAAHSLNSSAWQRGLCGLLPPTCPGSAPTSRLPGEPRPGTPTPPWRSQGALRGRPISPERPPAAPASSELSTRPGASHRDFTDRDHHLDNHLISEINQSPFNWLPLTCSVLYTHCILLIVQTAPPGRYYSHFREKKTEAQRVSDPAQGPSASGAKLGPDSRCLPGLFISLCFPRAETMS